MRLNGVKVASASVCIQTGTLSNLDPLKLTVGLTQSSMTLDGPKESGWESESKKAVGVKELQWPAPENDVYH